MCCTPNALLVLRIFREVEQWKMSERLGLDDRFKVGSKKLEVVGAEVWDIGMLEER
jgi:hypothetical protein